MGMCSNMLTLLPPVFPLGTEPMAEPTAPRIDANNLAPNGRVLTVLCGHREHEPVGQDIRAHVRLPKHVCAFEVNGCVVKPAGSDESLGEADFFGKGLSEQ